MTEVQRLFIRNLRRVRVESGYSQSALAEKCGLSTSYIAELESGRRFPSHETMDKLCAGLGLRPYMLFFDPDQDPAPHTGGTVGEAVRTYVRQRLTELLEELG